MKSHKNFILIIFSISISFGYSQNCKYDVDKKDPFTGKTLRSKRATLNSWGSMSIKFQLEEKKYTVGLGVTMFGKKEFYIKSGDTLFIALDNQEIIYLQTIDQYLPTYNASIGVNTMYDPQYAITDDELRRISTAETKAIQLKIGNETVQVEIGKKYAKKVKMAAGCIYNSLER